MSKQLSEFYVQKAKKELREDESRREQSLVLFKEWALKHSFIQILDPEVLSREFLLSFLRSKKYSMEKVYESYEATLMLRAAHPKWNYFEDDTARRIVALYDKGSLTALKDRDSEGRRVAISNCYFDFNNFTSDDVIRLNLSVFSVIALEEETQISGAVFICDCRNLTFELLSTFSIKDVIELGTATKIAPIRISKIIYIGLPTFATRVFNISKLAFSEKLRRRITILNSCEELQKHVDVSILPKEYGGKCNIQESIARFRPKLIDLLEFSKKINDSYKVDLIKVCSSESTMTGTFRKLEID